ncbi:MAG: RNA polymerase sigma factor SigM [Streptomycetales bacterium]
MPGQVPGHVPEHMPGHLPEQQPGVPGAPRRLTRSPVGETTDGDLLARHVDGDAGAFSELVRRHRDRLWAVALRTLGDPDEAADAVQDALISAFRAAHTYRGQASVTTWLYRIVVNACLDRVRRRAARPAVSLPDEDTLSREASAYHDDPIERRETRLEVARALAALPVEQRAALVLVDMQGFSVDEAARILGVAPGTVKSRCSRGRARLLPLVTHLRPARGPHQRDDRAGEDAGEDAGEAARNPSGETHVQPQTGQVAAEGGESAR